MSDLETKQLSILHMSPVAWPIRGGLSTVVHALTDAGITYGDNVQILTPANSRSEEENIYKLCRLCIPKYNKNSNTYEKIRKHFFDIRATYYINYKWKLNFHYPIIHIHFPNPSFAFLSNTKIPLCITYHGSDINALKRPVTSRHVDKLNNRAFAIFVVSNFLQQELIHLRPQLQNKIYCIPNARPSITTHNYFLNETKNKFNILFVGDLLNVKGVDLLVEAYIQLNAKYENLHLTIIGEGPEYKNMKKRFSECNIHSGVTFTGPLASDEVYKHMQFADILVLPSRREGLGNVLLESMMNRCPIVTSSAGGIPEIVKDGYNGRIFKTGDIDSLFNCIEELINFPELRTNLINGGQDFVQKYPDWNNIYLQYRSYYLKYYSCM